MDMIENLPIFVIPGAVLGLIFVATAVIKHLMHVCRPNEVLIFSGRKHTRTDGRSVGFRVVFGGRAFRMPVLETVERMDIALVSVSMTVQGAYSQGGIPLNLHAVANIKVSSDPQRIGNAIERFLGRSRMEIARVAKETLEGHLRGVLATMTPEEVNEDRLKFADQLAEEAGPDLEKLGLELDTLKIQHVTDDRNYLESIGRTRVAEILSEAQVAESDAQRMAEEAEAANGARGKVAESRANANIQRKHNQYRQICAELEARAKAEEERAQAAAQEARALAEQELQEVRGTVEELRLSADVTIPAEVQRRVHELHASGNAAKIFTDGEAMATSLAVIAKAWQDSGGHAMDMHVLQNLDDIFAEVARAARRLQVREVNLVDAGDGKTLPAYASAYPATVGALLEQVSRTLGIDIPRILKGSDATPLEPGAVPGAVSSTTPGVAPAAGSGPAPAMAHGPANSPAHNSPAPR